MSVITLPATGVRHALLARDNDQELQRYLSGAAQITSYPGRRWLLQFELPPVKDEDLVAWSLALHQLSDLSNTFLFTPPEYTGPSTGYAGANPVVNGAAQTGTSLVCDGVSASASILGAGDFLSFSVTTAKGNTNYELHRVTAAATSDASGNVTLSLARPIRLSPADGATVEIAEPVAQFRFTSPRAGIDLQLMRRAVITVDAEEAIYL